MAVLQKVKINNEWVPVSGSNVNSGGGGITEEKEVYIGEEEPTDDGAKLWIDPTGTPSGGNGGGTGGSNVFVFPEEALSEDYTEESPYFFTPEKTTEFLAALENPSSIYVAYQNLDGLITSMPFTISWTMPNMRNAISMVYMMQYLMIYNLHLVMVGDTLSVYPEIIAKQL